MDVKKFFPIAMFIGAQAAILQCIDQAIASQVYTAEALGFGWVSFQAWAMYFLSGCDIKGAIRTIGGYVIGIIASIVIMVLGGIFGSLGFFALPVALLIVVPMVIYFELMPWVLNYVPAVFVGAGAFFAFMSYVKTATFATAGSTVFTYCVIGLVFGFVTVKFRGWYESRYIARK